VPGGIDWLTIFIVLGGVALFFVGQLTLDHELGNLVALGSGVSFAASRDGVPQGRESARAATVRSDPLRPMFLGCVIGAVLGAPWLVTAGSPGGSGSRR